jgi:hypothetical protein
MKNLFIMLMFGFAMFVGFGAFAADDLVAAPAGFEWLGMVIQFLGNVPKVGPILAQVFGIVALIATVATALSVAVQSILKAPELVARFSGAKELAEKIDAIAKKVLPWLQYLSIFNVQKK